MNAQKFNRLLRKIKYDKNAVDEFYAAFYLRIKNRVQFRFGNLINSEDMAQEVFMKLYTMEPPDYFIKAPAIWIYRFTDNHVIDRLRVMHSELELRDSQPSAFDIEDTILKVDMQNAMSHLDTISQKILYLNIWEKIKLKDVAVMLNMSYVNVRQIASRARKELEPYLKELKNL